MPCNRGDGALTLIPADAPKICLAAGLPDRLAAAVLGHNAACAVQEQMRVRMAVWAYRVRDHFPDGVLYANLRGYGPGEPAAPGEVLEKFLRALGMSPSRIPPGVDAKAGLYRILLDSRRMLVLLDNARTADQVRPMLPPTRTCLTLITSRSAMTGLTISHGAARLTLGLLSAEESQAMLGKIIGTERADAEPRALAELADACGYLPLALRIAGQRAVFRPYMGLADIVAELRDQRSALDVHSHPADTATAVRSVHTADSADRALARTRYRPAIGASAGPRQDVSFDTEDAARAWFDAEHDPECRRRARCRSRTAHRGLADTSDDERLV